VLMYPAFVLVSCLVVFSVLALFVLPTMTQTVGDLLVGHEGDLATQTLHFLSRNIPPAVIGLFGLLVLVLVSYLALRVTESGRAALDRIMLASPVCSTCYRLSLLTRFSETLGLLLQSNVPIGDALYLTGECSPSATMRGACANVQHAVEGGRKLSEAMSSEPFFGPMLAYMVSIGEKHEAPHEELYSAAEIQAYNLRNRARRAAVWIEAIVLVLVALFVILLAWLIYRPVLALIQGMSEF
jgi:MSHA biogenesis protein MshG